MAFDMKDYIEVADRIKEWYAKHPDACIVTEITEFTADRVTVKAAVYREAPGSATVALPAGVGHSFLAIPGTTPYTKGSELENAETSAVGRALVFAGIPSKNVASGNEVRSKSSGGTPASNPAGSAPGPHPSRGSGASRPSGGKGQGSVAGKSSAAESLSPTGQYDKCEHSFVASPRENWNVCEQCGVYKKADAA